MRCKQTYVYFFSQSSEQSTCAQFYSPMSRDELTELAKGSCEEGDVG